MVSVQFLILLIFYMVSVPSIIYNDRDFVDLFYGFCLIIVSDQRQLEAEELLEPLVLNIHVYLYVF